MLSRRSVLQTISSLAVAAESRPLTKAPPNSADCHFHIYDARFPYSAKAILKPQPATVADYRKLQTRLGLSRCVLVQPSSYGTDNACLLDALRQFGPVKARGVAVVNTGVSDKELERMQAAGVRGIRFNLLQAGATTLEMMEPLSRRAAQLGWHVQVNVSSEQIVQSQKLFSSLPCPIVFDHLGHTVPAGSHDPAFAVLISLLKSGRGWLKLSGAYMDTKVVAPLYADTVPVARAYVEEAPGQLVWGSDWPHPTTERKPDDAVLFDLLAQWVPDEATRSKILVDNPRRLYGFA